MSQGTKQAAGAQLYKGIFFIILSSFCFAVMNLFVSMAGDVPAMQKSFFRNIVSALFAFLMIVKNGEKPGIRDRKKLPDYILRSLFGTLGIICNFYAVSHLNLADASMLNKMSPFFTLLFSMLILGETATLFQIACVAGAFVGSLFIIKPAFGSMALFPSLVGLCGGMAAGAAYTMLRKLRLAGEPGPMIILYFSVFSCVFCLPSMLLNYAPMSGRQLGMLLLAGLFASGGQFSITAAYSYAPANQISVYDYSMMIFSTLLGFFVLGQVPDALSFIGYFVICAMAVLMFLYNRRREV
ncbi:MAG: DMT family transporter [Stomatobaculum sp.]|nr:DMT family transporter [Stomatobaculum sp.]